jgi:DNA damage-inducible protein 1
MPDQDADVERMRLQALGDPQLMEQLRQTQPEFANMIQGDPRRFREMLASMNSQHQSAEQERKRQVEVEFSRRIELTARP